MPGKMKAAVVHEFGKPLTIDEIPIPEVGPGQALMKIISTGVCHTDLHAAEGDWPVKPNPPFVPGHEGRWLYHCRWCWCEDSERRATVSAYRGCTAPAAAASSV